MEVYREYAKYLYGFAWKIKIGSERELRFISGVCAKLSEYKHNGYITIENTLPKGSVLKDQIDCLLKIRDEIEVAYLVTKNKNPEIEKNETFIRKAKIKDFLKE
jgi:hypothetical protein